MDEEVWKDIKGFEGRYAISNMGRVKSLNYRCTGKEGILKPGKTKRGYLYVTLAKEEKYTKHYIHRLVLQNFSPVENMSELQVNHKDENKTNNRLENLEWVTCKENCNHGTRNARAAEKKAIPIVQLTLDGKFVKDWKSIHAAEREGGFDQGNINNCLKGKLKTHKGYRWCYLHEYIHNIDPRIKKVILFNKEYDF